MMLLKNRCVVIITFLYFSDFQFKVTIVFDLHIVNTKYIQYPIMGIQELQSVLENEGVGVDLFRIARNHAGGFRLVLDAEGCLDRLYGGYFSGKYVK